MSTNPYQSPPLNPNYFAPQAPDPEQAKQRLLAPAIILIVLAALTALLRIVGLAFALMTLGNQPQDAVAFNVGSMMGNGLALLLNVATIAGAYQMMRLESRSAAMAAAIISVIPICSPCLLLGIPFGIWALVILNDPQVKACFKS